MEGAIYIPLVDDNDNIIGHKEKLEVHLRGLLHRAFSILIYNSEGELLVHQRAFEKYHSPGLWTNTCCGHPNEGESMEAAVHRRLQEEMGFETALNYNFTFRYRAEFANGLIENEIDHVYVGTYDGQVMVNPAEVAAYRWQTVPAIKKDAASNPETYTYWFKEILKNL
jgi:isopentenyl-diphosphate Delta-isomerase